MKNWPPFAQSWKERLSLKFSDWVLRQATRLRKREKGVLGHLQFIAEKQKEWITRDNDDIAPRESLDLELQKIVFYDIYSVEEYYKLESGINKILKNYPLPQNSLAWIIEKIRDHKSWFGKARTTPFSAGMTVAGILYFGDTKGRYGPQYSKYANLWLTGITPSFVCLTIIVEPDEKLKTAYSATIKECSPIDLKLTFPNIKFGRSTLRDWHRIGESRGFALHVRQRTLDELLLKANQEIVRILRKYIGVGLAAQGPLPFIEILTVNQSSRKLPPQSDRARESPNDFNSRFWESIGYDIMRSNPYFFKYLRFYQTKRSRHYDLYAHQMLISTPDFKRSKDYKKDKELRNNVHSKIYYLAPHLCPLLSVQALFLRLQEDAIFSRNRLVPSLSRQNRRRLGIRDLRQGIVRLAHLNVLRFQQDRIWSELNREGQLSYLMPYLKGARRHPYKQGKRVEFLDDWLEDIQRLKEFNGKQIEVLRPAYEMLLSLKNTLVTYKLQRRLIWLSLILLGFTALMVPSQVWETLYSVLKDVFGSLQK